jgi:hypothetical protein
MPDDVEIHRRAKEACSAGQSDEEIAGILKDLPGGFAASMITFRNLAGVDLHEANARLRLTTYWSNYFGDSDEQRRFWRSLLLKDKH